MVYLFYLFFTIGLLCLLWDYVYLRKDLFLKDDPIRYVPWIIIASSFLFLLF